MPTPMMMQYFEIKNKYKDYLIFYRLGDFYELFYDDAKVASRELELVLTGRDCGEPERAPMCGVPYHSAEGYIGKLVSRGYKVAICEQLEEPTSGKSIVRRDVVRIITPGTLVESGLLSEQKNNYLAAVYTTPEATSVGIAFADISTGAVSATAFENDKRNNRLVNELGTYIPSEIIFNANLKQLGPLAGFIRERFGASVNADEGCRFDFENAVNRVSKQFPSHSFSNSVRDKAIISAIGALLDYISETQKIDISYISSLDVYSDGQYMEIDINTRRNLELIETMRTKEKRGTLLWVLDRTRTAMGARMLRTWIELPLIELKDILARQSAVRELYDSFILREELSSLLKEVLDLERLTTKIAYRTANGKDLNAIAKTIGILPSVRSLLSDCDSRELLDLFANLDTCEDLYSLITETISDDAPFSVREGGIIRQGFNEEVDNLRNVKDGGKNLKEVIEQRERALTGIKNLKIGYNKVFGYYIEVTNSQKDLVPDTYIRKQTLSNCERYITDELKEVEATVLGASDKLAALEYEIFMSLCDKLNSNLSRLQKVGMLLAKLDVYMSLADVAARYGYVCPNVDDSDKIKIRDGRHPVVERFVKDSYFVPNDTDLDTTSNRLALITGPNMAGKSTYMRQVALISIMAQIGSFVPAKSAHIGVVDKVFTRVGASDDLASGQSTFMLEMNEVAYILTNATDKSLIVYDEIGRGTSTFDGMSIAKAIAEHTADNIRAKTLFATHYHELTELENEKNGIVNYNIATKKRGDDITFLRKIVKGAVDDSYGIEVAKLAGVPESVIRRAKSVLAEIESGTIAIAPKTTASLTESSFDTDLINDVCDQLKKIDLNTLSPIEAMNELFRLKKMLEE
ncbi:MAG: DNA mismatch repair protein MutS [Ruminococcaceae bacterium]|nr:DNA mismatch repair protein MutS [Oscillospiraceae bacterium]